MEQELFDNLLKSVEEAGAIKRGDRSSARTTALPEPDIKKIRQDMELTQEKFAQLLGINVGTLRNWEQGRRRPRGPARTLIWVAEKHPEAILDAVHEQIKKYSSD